MPIAPRKVCRRPGCGKIASEGSWCKAHTEARVVETKAAQVKYDNERGSKHARGYTSKWSAYSVKYRKEHPFCVMCEKDGRLVLAQCVDHIIPVDGADDENFWNVDNHQSLCKTCHSVKTIKEDKLGFGSLK